MNSSLGPFFVAVSALSATLLLSVTAAVYSAAQTAGARYGLRIRDLAGRLGLAFALSCSAVLVLGLIEAAVSFRPDLDKFARVPLPFADLSQRPETALSLALGFGGCVALALLTLVRVIQLTNPATIGIRTAPRATCADFTDFQNATIGLPEPPRPENVERDLTWAGLRPALSGAGWDPPQPLAPEEERLRREQAWRRFEREKRRLSVGLESGVIRNPFSPAVNSLHQLIELRNLAAYKRIWQKIVERLDEWETGGTVDRSTRVGAEWLWSEIEELVRHALSAHFASAAVVTVQLMQTEVVRELRAQSRTGWTAPARHLSTVGQLAIEANEDGLISATALAYLAAAEQGIETCDNELFGQACLGLGHLVEVSCRHPRKPASIIALNNAYSFSNRVDAADVCAEHLRELAYKYRESSCTDYPLFLVDALVLGVSAALESRQSARGETAVECLYGLGEVMGHAIKLKDKQKISFVAGNLHTVSQQLAKAPFEAAVLARAWDSLAYDVINGLVACHQNGHMAGYADPCASLLSVVRDMPTDRTQLLGEVAWRSFLDQGTAVLQEVRKTLEAEVGVLGGWYV